MSDVNNMDVQENIEQGMVVYGQEPRPEAQNQQPEVNQANVQQENVQQENAQQEAPTEFELEAYFDKLDDHQAAATKYEHLTNVTNIIIRSLNRAGDNATAKALQSDISDFTRRAMDEGNAISSAQANAINEALSNEAADEVAVDTAKFDQAKVEYNGLMNRVKDFMRENPSNPAVSNIIRRTGGNLLSQSKHSIDLAKYEDRLEHKAAPGPNIEIRQVILGKMSKYIDTINEASENEFVVLKGNTSEERTKGRMFQMARSVGKAFQKNGIEIPELNDVNNVPNNLKDPKVKEDYLKWLDECLLKAPENKAGTLGHVSAGMDNFIRMGDAFKNTENYLKDVKNVIQDKSYSWEDRQGYLKLVQTKIYESQTAVNAPDVDMFLSSEETALNWLGMVGKAVCSRIQEAKSEKIIDMMALTSNMSKIGKKELDEIHAKRNLEDRKAELRHEEHNIINDAVTKGEESHKKLKDADPALMISSREFKNMLAASDRFKKGIKLIRDSVGFEGFSEEDMRNIFDLAKDLAVASQAYTDYKINALGQKAPNKTELNRLQAAANSNATAVTVIKNIHNYTVENAILDGPDAAITAIENRAYNGPLTERKMAEMLYLETVRRGYKKDSNGVAVRAALDYDQMDKHVNNIMTSPEFRSAANNIYVGLDGPEVQRRIYASYMQNSNERQQPQEEQPQQRQQRENQQQRQNQAPMM